MDHFLTIFNFGLRPGPPRFGFPRWLYRLGQIAQGGSPRVSAMIRSAFGQGCRKAFRREPAAYPFRTASFRIDHPRFQAAATMSAGCQSAGVIFFCFSVVRMKTVLAIKNEYVNKKNELLVKKIGQSSFFLKYYVLLILLTTYLDSDSVRVVGQS